MYMRLCAVRRMLSLQRIFTVSFLVLGIIRLYPEAGELNWRFTTGGKIRGKPSVTDGGVVYALSEDRHLYALNESTGSMIWRCSLGERVWESLSVGPDGSIYTVSKRGTIFAINPYGAIIWKFSVSGLPSGNPVVASDGTLYVGYESGLLVSLSHTGRLRWTLMLPKGISASPAVASDGTLYVPSFDRNMYAISSWGAQVWNAVLAGIPTSPAIAENGYIFVGTDYGSLVALDASGKILWDVLSQSRFLSPVISSNLVISATEDGTISAYNFEGELEWSTHFRFGVVSAVALSAEGSVFVIFDSGYVDIISTTMGVTLDNFHTPGKRGYFTLSKSGYLLCGKDDWLLYAFSAQPSARLGWPQAGSDPQHSGRQNAARRTGDVDLELENNVDYLYLRHLSDSLDEGDKLRAIREIETRIDEGSVGRSVAYVGPILESLASEGTTKTIRSQNRIINDFPYIRGEAALLLGKIGNFKTVYYLSNLLSNETDSAAAAIMVKSLGLLRSDREGAAIQAISQKVREDKFKNRIPNAQLAVEAINAIGSIYSYHGIIPHQSGYDTLFSIYTGAYPKVVRQKALEVMSFKG